MTTITLPCGNLRETVKGLQQLPLEQRDITLIGKVTLKDLDALTDEMCFPVEEPDGKIWQVPKRPQYAVVDLSQAEWGCEEEEWSTGAWSHCGYVCFNSGTRQIEVLRRMLHRVKARCVVLPVDAARRHLNSALINEHILSLRISDESKLFSMDGDSLCNKKKTRVWFAPRV